MWKGLHPHRHPHVGNKNKKGYLGYGGPTLWNKGSQPHTRIPSPGLQCYEENSPLLLAVKTNRDCG